MASPLATSVCSLSPKEGAEGPTPLEELEKASHPLPRPLTSCGLWAGPQATVEGGRRGKAGAGPRRGVGGEEAPRAHADPLVLPCHMAPGRSTIPSHTPPANLGTSRRNSQPAAQLVCLIRSSLTSSAKLSRVNPITSNHSIWHMLQYNFIFGSAHAVSLFGIKMSLISGHSVCSDG